MLVELYYVTNAYAFNTVRDDSNFAVNLWDHFYKKFAKRKRNGDKAGLFETYKDYTFELSSLFKNFSEIDEKKPNEEVTDITKKIETYKKLKVLQNLIKNADFGTFKKR